MTQPKLKKLDPMTQPKLKKLAALLKEWADQQGELFAADVLKDQKMAQPQYEEVIHLIRRQVVREIV